MCVCVCVRACAGKSACSQCVLIFEDVRACVRVCVCVLVLLNSRVYPSPAFHFLISQFRKPQSQKKSLTWLHTFFCSVLLYKLTAGETVFRRYEHDQEQHKCVWPETRPSVPHAGSLRCQCSAYCGQGDSHRWVLATRTGGNDDRLSV